MSNIERKASESSTRKSETKRLVAKIYAQEISENKQIKNREDRQA